jgi:hypothetical protein
VVAYMGVEPYLECSWNRATHTQVVILTRQCVDSHSLLGTGLNEVDCQIASMKGACD